MIYVSGVSPRSGTNWLSDLIVRHPKCKRGLAEEDNFVRFSHHLIEYIEDLKNRWRSDWTAQRAEMDKLILRAFGAGLKRVLEIGSSNNVDLSQFSEDQNPLEWPSSDKRVITKTPYVKNINFFFKIFPDTPLIILVRDGRSVVESAMRTFGWKFDTAARRWRDAAKMILEFDEKKDDNLPYYIVRYEDLYKDTICELESLFDFLSLDTAVYDFEEAVEAPVVGSSTYGQKGGEVDWKPVEKKEDFDPLRRWEAWSGARHDRFSWIAGDELEAFGYTPVGRSHSPKRKARFAYWNLFEKVGYTVHRVRRGIGRRIM